ncbi:MFS transporter [Phytohabitans kaempferiae]|uniref:MFS transporter n=1 Tax=Phytohabitans kaempferiae TaxID=1620943 RepID=A0ABV6MB81_9ACTN
MTRRLHPAWLVAAVAFVALVGAAGFRATPAVMLHPLHEEFRWPLATISAAVSVNLILYGLTAPFAAALMERFGMRRVVAAALVLVAAGSGLTVFMNATWQLILCWGVLVGLGTGSMALAFVATVTGRWFVKRRGLVTGVLTAGGAAGQLVFLPLLATVVEARGWRVAALIVAGAALLVVPLVLWRLRDQPADLGVTAYGGEVASSSSSASGGAAGSPAILDGSAGAVAASGGAGGSPAAGGCAGRPVVAPGVAPLAGGPAARAVGALRAAARTRAFWLLAGGFAICGATTNGLVGTHFIPAAHDHGMAETTAAGLLALVGLFDIAGTIASGWLTDRVDSRILLGAYYALRGGSLLVLPSLFAETAGPTMLVFIVFYGLDWVATVPPTVVLCRQYFGDAGPIVFGWVFASHQIGAAVAATGAGLVRDQLGTYALAWYAAGALSIGAAVLSLLLYRGGRVFPVAIEQPAPKVPVGWRLRPADE